MKTLEVFFTPADFDGLKARNLDAATCVVLDVFRATTSMITALGNGARSVIPVSEIGEAVALRTGEPGLLLAGERHGVRISGELSGGVEFDFGNSPREFTRDRVGDRDIAMTTTNGTRALQACAHANRVLAAAFVNLRATAEAIIARRPESLLIICSGTFEQSAYEDMLAAGALCDLVWDDYADGAVSDSALAVLRLYQPVEERLLEAASQSRNGRRLLSVPDLKDDVAFCVRRDVWAFAAERAVDGRIRAVAAR